MTWSLQTHQKAEAAAVFFFLFHFLFLRSAQKQWFSVEWWSYSHPWIHLVQSGWKSNFIHKAVHSSQNGNAIPSFGGDNSAISSIPEQGIYRWIFPQNKLFLQNADQRKPVFLELNGNLHITLYFQLLWTHSKTRNIAQWLPSNTVSLKYNYMIPKPTLGESQLSTHSLKMPTCGLPTALP